MSLTTLLQVLPPVASCNGDPPAFNLVQLDVCHVHSQREARHPYAHLQLCTQETISKIDHHTEFPFCLFPIYVNVVAALRHLEIQKTQKKHNTLIQPKTITSLQDSVQQNA